MTIQLLIQRLEQKVQHLYQDYLPQREEKIFAKFDRSLFSEYGQTVGFYLTELKQTLDKIKMLKSDIPTHYAYLAERLVAQCTVLSEALARKKNTLNTQSSSATFAPVKSPQHNIHRLPPRERLEKYYEALEKLNKLYQEQCDLARTSLLHDDAIRHTQLAERYKQRHQKCQDAIDLLEEYLAFKEEQGNHTL